MTTLVDFQIRQLMSRKPPLVAPFDEALINPCSIDCLLGDEIMIESAQSPEMNTKLSIADTTKDEPFLLKPGQFILAVTREVVCIPDNLSAIFMLKSSRAREGIEHSHAGFIDAGFHGAITLEISNVRQLHSIPLWAGMKIGQLVISQCSEIPLQPYHQTGRYCGDKTVTASKG